MKLHMAEVAKLPAYVELMTSWPETVQKVSLFLTGMSDASAATPEECCQGNETATTVEA